MRLVWWMRIAGAALAVAVSCGGGVDPAGSPSLVPTGGSRAAVSALFRACHRTLDGDVSLVFLFENHDRSLLGEFSGNLTFGASVISPTIWKTTGETPEAVPGYNDLVKQVHVPEQEPIPDEISFKVWIFDEGDEAEYTGEVSGLSGAGLRAPFGVLSIRSVQQAGSDLQVFVELGEQTNLPAALQWQGAHEVELSGASTTIQGEVSPVSEGAQTFTFPGAGTIAGPLTIRVTSWQLLSTSEHTSPVPSSACAR